MIAMQDTFCINRKIIKVVIMNNQHYIEMGLVYGVVIGIIIGTLTSNVGIGLALGATLGLAFGVEIEQWIKEKK